MTLAFARFQLTAHFSVAGRRLHKRDGVLIRHTTQGGLVHWSEASPLPGLSSETVDDVVAALSTRHLDELRDEPQLPSLSWALAHHIGADTILRVHPQSARLLLSPQDVDDSVHRFHDLQTVKLKVGGNDVDAELSAIQRLRERVPGLRLRLDGNRRLSVATTHQLAAAAGASLEWMEEPTELTLVNQIAPDIPLVADEVFLDVKNGADKDDSNVQQLLHRATAYVLKPMVLGASTTSRWTHQAAQQGKRCIISSCYESAVGRSLLAVVAASVAPADVVHGLGTGAYFDEDFSNDVQAQTAHLQWREV
jgi:o-succinylbenzoate synthase